MEADARYFVLFLVYINLYSTKGDKAQLVIDAINLDSATILSLLPDFSDDFVIDLNINPNDEQEMIYGINILDGEGIIDKSWIIDRHELISCTCKFYPKDAEIAFMIDGPPHLDVLWFSNHDRDDDIVTSRVYGFVPQDEFMANSVVLHTSESETTFGECDMKYFVAQFHGFPHTMVNINFYAYNRLSSNVILPDRWENEAFYDGFFDGIYLVESLASGAPKNVMFGYSAASEINGNLFSDTDIQNYMNALLEKMCPIISQD
uniref:uncharacterized protein LOC120325861 n=1 Tax=Styela clava TaxID=7725 RepID=UPI00193A26EF|nr:uncharacterized protein LOC120325861 [Styela clava]